MTANPWIPVGAAAKLPEPWKAVVLLHYKTENPDDPFRIMVGGLTDKGEWFCEPMGWNRNMTLTHWMPIPEIPE